MPEPFKNRINPQVVEALGQRILSLYPDFSYDSFVSSCLAELDNLELKERAKLIGETLWSHLPPKPQAAIELVGQTICSLPLEGEEDSEEGWLLFPISSLIEAHGPKAFDTAIALLPELTKRFTAEFAIRPFIIEYPEQILETLEKWVSDPNPHVRRLVSEGTRPRLPWAQQIPAFIEDPNPVLPLLERLKDDPSEYVRRSVANNLNDIAKDHPSIVLERMESWQKQSTPQRQKLIRHACRTLIKNGDPRCLKLLGYAQPELVVEQFFIKPVTLKLGERLTLSTQLQSTATTDQDLIIDYRIHLVKANGRTAPKVFKGSTLKVPARSQKTLQKTFHLKPITTRTYYTGVNSVELIVNGISLARSQFRLEVE